MERPNLLGKRLLSGLAIVAVAVCVARVGCGWAYQLPAVNLGATSFLDGGPPAGPGFYFSQYIQYYHSTRLTNGDGDRLIPGANEHLNVWASLSQFIYQSNQEVFPGARWGMNVIVPAASMDLDQRFPVPADNGAGFGDITLGPFLQWDPIMGKDGPLFMHRIEFQFLVPTGKYDSNHELNPGSNFFSFDPYWAATVFITPKVTASWRIHYLWNAENGDPSQRLFPGASDSQAGQAFHLNFAADYELWEKRLRAGLNGYYLKQFTDDQVSGRDIPSSREQVLGIGPGLVFHYSQNTHFFLNLYFEAAAENRPEGTRLNVRWVQHF